MNCPKCGTPLNPQAGHCLKCGLKFTVTYNQPSVNKENIEQNNVLEQNPEPQTNVFQQDMEPQTNVFQQAIESQDSVFQQNMEPQNNIFSSSLESQSDAYQQGTGYSRETISDDELLDAYIGKNAAKLKDENAFSFPTFFFGIIYLLYRKIWSLVAITLLLDIIIVFICKDIFHLEDFSVYETAIIIFINGVMASNFNRVYINNAKRKIKKIRTKNENKPKEEIIKKCKKKGRPTILPVIIVTIILIVAYAIGTKVVSDVAKNAKESAAKTEAMEE